MVVETNQGLIEKVRQLLAQGGQGDSMVAACLREVTCRLEQALKARSVLEEKCRQLARHAKALDDGLRLV